MQPLPLSVRRLWRLIGLAIGVAVIVLGTAGALAISLLGDGPSWLVVFPVVAGLLLAGVWRLIADIRYRSWRFELTDTWIQGRWGVIGRHTATIPRNRVQTLTSENGPIDRMLGLTSVTIHTAGAQAPNLTIPHLEDATVDWLRSELAQGRLESDVGAS